MSHKSLSLDEIRQFGLTPAATASVPIAYFERHGVEFVRDEDGLNSIEFAGLVISGNFSDCFATIIRLMTTPQSFCGRAAA